MGDHAKIFDAVNQLDESKLRDLLDANISIDSRNAQLKTVLMMVCWVPNIDAYKMLVRNGADLNAVDSKGNNTFSSACIGGDVDIIQDILSRGDIDVNQVNNHGYTGLMLACYFRHHKVVELLLQHYHIDISKKCGKGQTALDIAIENHDQTVVTMIVEYIQSLQHEIVYTHTEMSIQQEKYEQCIDELEMKHSTELQSSLDQSSILEEQVDDHVKTMDVLKHELQALQEQFDQEREEWNKERFDTLASHQNLDIIHKEEIERLNQRYQQLSNLYEDQEHKYKREIDVIERKNKRLYTNLEKELESVRSSAKTAQDLSESQRQMLMNLNKKQGMDIEMMKKEQKSMKNQNDELFNDVKRINAQNTKLLQDLHNQKISFDKESDTLKESIADTRKKMKILNDLKLDERKEFDTTIQEYKAKLKTQYQGFINFKTTLINILLRSNMFYGIEGFIESKEDTIKGELFNFLETSCGCIIPNSNIVINEDNEIGKTSWGKLYHGKHNDNDIIIKRIEMQKLNIKRINTIIEESRKLADLAHENIVNFHGLTRISSDLILVWENESLVLEDYLNETSQTEIDMDIRIDMMKDVVNGLIHLHDHNIIHGYLRSRNVMYVLPQTGLGSGILKLDNFRKGYMDKCVKNRPLEGRLRWRPPETFSRNYQRGEWTDIYSLGMLFWEILTNNTLPYEDARDDVEAQQWILNNQKENIPNFVPLRIQVMMQECWERQYKMRPSARQIMEVLKLDYNEEPHFEDDPQDGQEEKKTDEDIRHEEATEKTRKAHEERKSKKERRDKEQWEIISDILRKEGQDAYTILGVCRSDSIDVIRKKWQKLIKLTHEDKNQNYQKEAKKASQIINSAWDIIQSHKK